MATGLAEALQSPIRTLSADWFFKKMRDIRPCRTHARCSELASSVDAEGLAQDVYELSAALASAPTGPVPELKFGHRAHGVHGVSATRPVTVSRSGFILTNEPVYVVIEGFVLFADPGVCAMLHAAIWLEAEDGEMLARRRFIRNGGEDEEAWRAFREDFIDHVYAHHLQAAPSMLVNADPILSGTITITANTTVDAVVAEARRLLAGFRWGGRERERAAVGSKREAPGFDIASPSASNTGYDSPLPTRPPCTPQPPFPPPSSSSLLPSEPCTPPPQLQPPPPPQPPPPLASAPSIAYHEPDQVLASLPPGSRVAVLDFLGSLCPITTSHVQCLVEARRILTGEAPPVNADGALQPYAVCLGAMCVNSDSYVSSKLRQAGEKALSQPVRLELCRIATAAEASWIRVGTPADEWVESLGTSFPSLNFTLWRLNGADDVVRHEKWECATRKQPYITMGREGDTPTILEAISRDRLTSDAFVLGPNLPEVSSTAAREAIRQADHPALERCLHPEVAAWLQQHGPYRPLVVGGQGGQTTDTPVTGADTSGIDTLSRQLVAIGDLHGNLPEAQQLWSNVEARMGAAALSAADVVFLGDYCDRGPDTRGVLDWLVQLRETRTEGTTHFLAGNHDFGFAAFLGVLPIDDPLHPPLDLDGTKDPRFSAGFWPHPVPGGMHYQGRRWGEGHTYNSNSTFASYGVELDGSLEIRERLACAVPAHHKDFLQRMVWVHEAERTWGRVVCVHAGLNCDAPLAPQLAALKARDLSSSCLHAGADSGRLVPLSERRAVEPMHPELAGRALLLSGHHGFASLEGDRIILDASGGLPAAGRPIQACILPARTIVGSDGSGAFRRTLSDPDTPPSRVAAAAAPRLPRKGRQQ